MAAIRQSQQSFKWGVFFGCVYLLFLCAAAFLERRFDFEEGFDEAGAYTNALMTVFFVCFIMLLGHVLCLRHGAFEKGRYFKPKKRKAV